jgi:nitrogen-specific signal transduction histidine kinase
MSGLKELSSLIISMEEVIGKLNSFFTDSIILKMDYSIQTLGCEVESLTDFSSTELSGQSFSKICADQESWMKIEAELRHGFFADVTTSFLTREKKSVSVSISGFYLGLISDINGYIILKIKLLEDNAFLKRELVTKKRELDTFIYRAAHDLRGPLATIKGLVNLLKIRQGNHEVDELLGLIEIHANKLDDRLFKLLYLADDNNEAEHCQGVIEFSGIKKMLEKTLNDTFQIDHAIFEFNCNMASFIGINEHRLTQLLNNALLYIIGLPLATVAKEEKISITIDIEGLKTKLKIKIQTRGFVTTQEIREVISQPISLYNDILHYPFLFNYFIAQREAKQLGGVIIPDFAQVDEQVLHLTIPVNFSLTADYTNMSSLLRASTEN